MGPRYGCPDHSQDRPRLSVYRASVTETIGNNVSA